MNQQQHSHTPRLNQDDQQRVDTFIATGVNRHKKKPFRPWAMMFWLTISIIALGAAARLIGHLYMPH